MKRKNKKKTIRTPDGWGNHLTIDRLVDFGNKKEKNATSLHHMLFKCTRKNISPILSILRDLAFANLNSKSHPIVSSLSYLNERAMRDSPSGKWRFPVVLLLLVLAVFSAIGHCQDVASAEPVEK
jgi:hypothetical protein